MKVKGVNYRTIWPDTKDNKIIHIIDQRHLPHEFVVEDLKTVQDFETAIRDMHVRGAGLIGATAGFGMYIAALSAPENNMDEYIKESSKKILATRPTAGNLAWAVEKQVLAIAAEQGLEAKIKASFSTACAIADEDAEFCRSIGQHGKTIIEKISRLKPDSVINILTHCNAGWLAFVDYGSATAPIYAAHRAGIKVHVWVDETRPWLQGAKLTAWELKEEGIPHTLIPDNTGGHLMQNGLVDMVIVGTDRTTRTGNVVNKIGTYLKAVAAYDNHVPFYVALPSSSFDWNIGDNISDIPIEQRSSDEIKYVSGRKADGGIETVLIAPEETKTANYGFDITPSRLVTGLITERGVVAAGEDAILELYPEHKC